MEIDLFKKNRQKGFYQGAFSFEFTPYQGKDYSKSCFVFTGQGAAFAGMFKDEVAQLPEVLNLLEAADKIAVKNKLPAVSDFINNVKIEREFFHVLKNVSLYCLEVGFARYLIEQGIRPSILTGHSFGEFSALVVSGVLSFEDGLRFVLHREYVSPIPYTRGQMIAISGNNEAISNCLGTGEEYYFANFNGPRQTVISVKADDSLNISKKLKEGGFANKILETVPQPYHSPLLADAAKKMNKWLKSSKLKYNKPNIPIFSSVLKKLIDQSNFKKELVDQILEEQFLSPVDFTTQIKNIHEFGAYRFIEIGPGSSSISFIKSILEKGEYQGVPVSKFLPRIVKQSERTLSNQEIINNPVYGRLTKLIGELTGYDIADISLDDRFQDDLGIDSLKKAEIIFRIIEEDSINPGQDFSIGDFQNLGDAVDRLHFLKNRQLGETELSANFKAEFKKYTFEWKEAPLVFGSFDYFNHNRNFQIFTLQEILKRNEEIADSEGIIIDAREELQKSDDYFSLVKSFQNFALRLSKISKFLHVCLIVGDNPRPIHFAISGLLKSLAKETNQFSYKMIATDNEKENLEELFTQELFWSSDYDIRYQKGKRYHRQLKLINDSSPNSLDGKNIVSIGGTRGTLFELLMRMVPLGGSYTILGRSNAQDEKVLEAISTLKSLNPNVSYLPIDASRQGAFIKDLANLKRIDFLINGAGTEISRLLVDKDDKEIQLELDSKIGPLKNIIDLCQEIEVGKVLNFSSIAGAYGNDGQTIYSFANNILQYYPQTVDAGKTSFKTIHWPAWDRVGMTENLGVLQKLREKGLSLIKPDVAFELFLTEFSSGDQENESLYLDLKDQFLMEITLSDYKKLFGVIGKIKTYFPISFSKNFNLKFEPFLADHHIDDMVLVPASMGIGLFYLFLFYKYGCFQDLINFSISNMIVIGEGGKDVSLSLDSSGKKHIELNSNLKHFSSDYLRSDQALGRFDKQFNPTMEIIPGSFYHKESVDFGPAFQLVNITYYNDNNDFCIHAPLKDMPRYFGIEFLDRFIQWVEIGIQAVSLKSIHLGHGLGIPLSIEKIESDFSHPVSDVVYFYPEFESIEGNSFTGSVVMTNQDGDVLFKLSGILYTIIKKFDEIPYQVRVAGSTE